MISSELVKYLEDKDIEFVNKDWFYHASIYEREKYESILTKGILSNVARDGLIRSKNGGWNGKFYISVVKRDVDGNNTILESAWYNVLYTSPKFIISDKVKALKARSPYMYSYTFSSSFIPIRNSMYKDEWHIFYKVKEEDIIGIVYNLSDQFNSYFKDEDYFNNLLEIVKILNKLGLDIPIYDYVSFKEINKDKCLKFVKF